MTYPSGRLIEYPSLDRAGRVLKVQGTLAGTTTEYAKAVTYNASGQMSSLTFGNDLIERWDYNPRRLQPWQIRLGTAAVDDARGRWQFGYCAGQPYNEDCASNNGNVMHQRILPLNLYQTYAYDTLNRLSLFEEKATNTAPACAAGGSTPCRAYGYDNWSNQFVTQANVVTRHSFTPAAASNFDAANRLIIQGSTYDPAGNQTGIGGYTFTYDAENRLKTSKIGDNTTTYAYDGEGRRVKKGNETYVYDAFGNLAAEYGGTAAAAGTRYLTTDHLGSTRLITKADGEVDQRIDYLPFGKAIPNGVSGRATGMGYQTSNYLDPLKPGFTGKERDAETGLDYFGARYMSAAQGRFTSADAPFADQIPADPQSWNLFAYARNNPLRYVDRDGRCVSGVDTIVCLAVGWAATELAEGVWKVKASMDELQVVADNNAAAMENLAKACLDGGSDCSAAIETAARTSQNLRSRAMNTIGGALMFPGTFFGGFPPTSKQDLVVAALTNRALNEKLARAKAAESERRRNEQENVRRQEQDRRAKEAEEKRRREEEERTRKEKEKAGKG
ncbi:MAG: RHS repeat-associated core domain-containing protein [Bryobacteraceae bacterium]|nr:RHS repeat-associated core domain-containing protein [Bryobacteraceae bacterium]